MEKAFVNLGYSIREYNIIKKLIKGETLSEAQKDEVEYIINEL